MVGALFLSPTITDAANEEAVVGSAQRVAVSRSRAPRDSTVQHFLCERRSMYSHMRIYYTSEEEHQYWGRLHIRYYSGDLFIIPLTSMVNSRTISVFETFLLILNSIPGPQYNNNIYIRLSNVIISSLQQLPHTQHHPPVLDLLTLRTPITLV